MTEIEQWAEDYLNSIEGIDIYYSHRRAGFLAGIEKMRKEAAAIANFNGPCLHTHCDCQFDIRDQILEAGKKTLKLDRK